MSNVSRQEGRGAAVEVSSSSVAFSDSSPAMILEAAPLHVSPGQSEQFEAAFLQTQKVIRSMPSYISHELQRCIERQDEYILLVRWQSLEAHEVGFRKSPQYQEWRQLLHHFYEPFPVVSHYVAVGGAVGG